ncbi:hypothetical protein DL765_000639 [Monosporascus sp. GIB2]|nr:hypothetical protein DL765_000639 [Monosporascus sp. GIB2]
MINADSKRPTVRVGVFIPSECQLFDAACVDIFGSLSHQYMRAVSALVPKAVIDLAPNVEISYIGSVRAGEPIQLTSNERILATHHYTDAEVAPGKLDIVLVPGPDPFVEPEKEPLEWLRRQGQTEGTDILSVCTGIFLCGGAGLLKGKRACGPRGLQDRIKSKGFGEKELVGHKYRWIQDGNIWSSGGLPLFPGNRSAADVNKWLGGVTNGNDLVAAYCRASRHFPRPLVETVCEMVDVGDRLQEYGKSQSTFILTMVLNAFTAWLMGFGRRR